MNNEKTIVDIDRQIQEQLPIKQLRKNDMIPKRNEKCPCGSGKKYKWCCLRLHEKELREDT